MKLKLFQVDAFTSKLFGGNPAAVCPLEKWLDDSVLLSIANENNLAETAFYVPVGSDFEIKWFTPTTEVALCGHATLAAAHILYTEFGYSHPKINFHSKSGILSVSKEDNLLTLDFPADEPTLVSRIPDGIMEAFDKIPTIVYKGKTDYLLVFKSQKDIESLKPDFRILKTIDARGIIVTSKGDRVDFVSRFFGPQSGIDEDYVTGSAHTTLTPYWAKILRKETLKAIQLSSRKGELLCTMKENRVEISGQAITYLRGEIEIA